MDKMLKFLLTRFMEEEINQEIVLEFLGVFKQGLKINGYKKEMINKIDKIMSFFMKYKETIKINDLYFNFSDDVISPS